MIDTCLLDSGIHIDILNGKRGRRELIEGLIRGGAEMACCPIQISEIYSGLRPGEEAQTERLLWSLKFYPITWEIAKQAGELLNVWRQRGRTVSLPDTTIAAVALFVTRWGRLALRRRTYCGFVRLAVPRDAANCLHSIL